MTITLERAPLLVLGGGPGGYTAAFRAADLGLSVTLVEREPALGGVCLHVGCIPSKTLLHVAEVIDQAAALGPHGVRFGAPSLDLDALRAHKTAVVDRLAGGLAGLARRRGVRVLRATATLAGPHLVRLEGLASPEGDRHAAGVTAPGDSAEPAELPFDQAILATGSRTLRLPGLPWGDPRLMDSEGALALPDVPRRLLVVGGGIIGLEMATVYRALGSEVTVVELTERLIPEADADLLKPLADRLRAKGVTLLLRTRVVATEPEPEGLRVAFDGAAAPAPVLFDRVLVAVGRRPNGDLLGAEAAGLRVTERGAVPVDSQQRTNVPHLFAIGDLTPGPMLAHKAMHEARVAAEVAAGEPRHLDALAIPSVAYTDPEVAWVGLTETAARAEGREVRVGRFPWVASGRALGLGRPEGHTKLLFDPDTDRLLGAGLVGPHAGELLAELTLAIELGAEAEDLALTIHPHPTLSETAGLAAEAYLGTLTDLLVPGSAAGRRRPGSVKGR